MDAFLVLTYSLLLAVLTAFREMNMLIDLSHTIEHGMITYKGLPAPVISIISAVRIRGVIMKRGTEFHIGRIEMVANTGTYLDSPFHRYEDGRDPAELELQSLPILKASWCERRKDLKGLSVRSHLPNSR